MATFRHLLQQTAILEHILQYLSLDEQIECVDVCEAFWYTIVKVLWKKQYRRLNIYKTPYVSIITNIMHDQQVGASTSKDARFHRIWQLKTALKYDKCNAFLMQIAKSVHQLRVFSEYFSFEKSLGVAFRNIQMFKNLNYLSYNQMVVTEEQLELIAKSCRKLKRLEFIECTCGELKPLVPGDNLEIRYFAKMPELEELVVECEPVTPAPEMECDVIYEMLANLRLRRLVLKNIITTDSDADTVNLTNGLCLQSLSPGYISLEFWPDLKHHLRDFRNLKELTINVLDCNTLVNSSVLELLVINCRQLQQLALENCDLYVEDFGILKTVRHLALVSCGGFTASNLQQVLGSLPLVSLSLMNTRVLGPIETMYVSPALESLTVDTIYYTSISEAFQRSLNPMHALHTIRWMSGDIHNPWIIEKCPQLRSLHVPNPYLLRRYILQMSSLRVLSFTSCKGFSWCFLLVLIRNLLLQRLDMRTRETIDDLKEIPQTACGVRTTLQRIVLPYRIFKSAQDFWMDLLRLNEQLHLVYYGDHVDLLNAHFLRGLLQYEHVRDRLTHLKICGFSVDIKDLKENFDETVYLMNTNTSHYRAKNSDFTIEL